MSHQTTSRGFLNAISSPELESGLPPSGHADGPMISRSGPDPRHANLSAAQASKLGLMIPDTSGRRSSGSSDSANLTSSLESRLRANQPEHGSTLFLMNWSRKDTPAGRPLPWLVGSALRTNDNGPTGWPTPRAAESTEAQQAQQAREARGTKASKNLTSEATLASWPTDGNLSHSLEIAANHQSGKKPTNQEISAQSADSTTAKNANALARPKRDTNMKNDPMDFTPASWPTCSSRDHKDTTGMATTGLNPDGSERNRLDQLGRVVGLAEWTTPCADDTSQRTEKYKQGGSSTSYQAGLAGPARRLPSGEILTGSSVGTINGGQLNPAHSRWLMGLDPAWDECSPGYDAWDTMQKLFKRFSGSRARLLRELVRTALSDSKGTATPS
jgi:hypothetical protein